MRTELRRNRWAWVAGRHQPPMNFQSNCLGKYGNYSLAARNIHKIKGQINQKILEEKVTPRNKINWFLIYSKKFVFHSKHEFKSSHFHAREDSSTLISRWNLPTASINPSFSMISRRTLAIDSPDSMSIWRTNSVLLRRFKILVSARNSLLDREGIVTKTLYWESEFSAKDKAKARFILCEDPVKSTTLGPTASSSFWLCTLFRMELRFLLNRLFAAPIFYKIVHNWSLSLQLQAEGKVVLCEVNAPCGAKGVKEYSVFFFPSAQMPITLQFIMVQKLR